MDRLDHITLPLLSGLAKSLDRPQIEHPDLVILNSGYWDLRKYTEGALRSIWLLSTAR